LLDLLSKRLFFRGQGVDGDRWSQVSGQLGAPLLKLFNPVLFWRWGAIARQETVQEGR
jgi:hypothetical protein